MIDKAIMEKYAEPEWYLGFEVGNSCGSQCRRHADAIAICAYPSRGFETIGFEVKISRSDLQHELDNPAKCEEMYQYTNEWFLVVPKGLVGDMRIPEPWGIIEYCDGKLKQKRKACWHDAKVTSGFLCAFIRGRQRMDEQRYMENVNEIRKQAKEEFEWRLDSNTKELVERKKSIDAIEKATGLSLDQWSTKQNIRLLKVAKKLDKTLDLAYLKRDLKRDLDLNMKQLTECTEKIQTAYALLNKLLGEEVEP